jgi:hypothetical protein
MCMDIVCQCPQEEQWALRREWLLQRWRRAGCSLHRGWLSSAAGLLSHFPSEFSARSQTGNMLVATALALLQGHSAYIPFNPQASDRSLSQFLGKGRQWLAWTSGQCLKGIWPSFTTIRSRPGAGDCICSPLGTLDSGEGGVWIAE